MKSLHSQKVALRFVGALAIAVFTASIAFAQAVSQFSGVAHDTSGAVIQGVDITSTALDTGVKRTTATDENGAFTLPNLAPGPYRLEAAKPGFRTFVQTGIQLQVDSNPVIPVVLGVGDVTETVEVQANATLVETQKLGVGNVMENQRILDLPLNGRTPTDCHSPAYGRGGTERRIPGLEHEYRRHDLGRRRPELRCLLRSRWRSEYQPLRRHQHAAPVPRRAAGI